MVQKEYLVSKDNPLVEVMQGIADAFDKETPDTLDYKGVLSANKDSNLYQIFDAYHMVATEPCFIVSKILKQKYGLNDIDNELYWFIRDFPSYIDKLSREIEEKEGMVCCVDKAWQRSLKKLEELIKANKEKNG